MSLPGSDGAPEQRWRRTLDLRKRPATLKVARLLEEFGYTELSTSAAAAVEARLAKVNLVVEPSLEGAALGDLVAITHSVRRPARVARAQTMAPQSGAAPADARPRTHRGPVEVDASERILSLERELADARSQVEQMRAELEKRQVTNSGAPAARADDSQPPAMIGEQTHEVGELIEALHHAHSALAVTRSEIRRCSDALGSL